MGATEAKRVVFFDGVCGLCDRAVSFLVARDKAHRLSFAPLQGETAARLLPERLRTPPLDTLVFWQDGAVAERSTAVLRIAVGLGGAWRALALLLLVPRVVRDLAYKAVARNRYAVFGKKDSCRLPTPAERAYFLP